jgi:hypothetical protein
MLFDKLKRFQKSPKGYSEPLYDYLNRSTRPSSGHIRSLLNEWFSHFPSDHKNELQRRFCSSDDLSHQSAFFELYMYELLFQSGFKVEVHPYIEGESTHPEFLAYLNNDPAFYLECTLAEGPKKEVSTEKRENIVYDTIDKLNSPNFFIEVKVKGSPNTPPPGAKWEKFLYEKLSRLDPDEIASDLETGGLDSLPSWSRNHDGWDVTFRAIPKSPEARGKTGIRPIGIKWFDIIECKEHENIRNALKEKAGRYGKFKIPYIIAINSISYFCDDISIANALFGDEKTTVTLYKNGSTKQEHGRHPNGAWIGPRGPQNTRVSAALIFKYLLWGNIEKETPILWHNPWAQYPLTHEIWPLPQKLIDKQGRIEFRKGKNPFEIFNLSPNWLDIAEENR